jgi:DNA-binding transcriptional MerR regulator
LLVQFRAALMEKYNLRWKTAYDWNREASLTGRKIRASRNFNQQFNKLIHSIDEYRALTIAQALPKMASGVADLTRGSMKRNSNLARNSPEQAALANTPIPDKMYFRIGEVSRLTRTKAYVLRYWETEFPSLKPKKTPTGHRLYRRKDVEIIFEIKRLLYQQGFTIDGARKKLAGNSKGEPEQKPLFQQGPSATDVRAIRRELETILTILSRKC